MIEMLSISLSVRELDKCKLFCRAENSSAYYMLDAKVEDGTKCDDGTFDTCVDGMCVPTGCDHVIMSGKELG